MLDVLQEKLEDWNNKIYNGEVGQETREHREKFRVELETTVTDLHECPPSKRSCTNANDSGIKTLGDCTETNLNSLANSIKTLSESNLALTKKLSDWTEKYEARLTEDMAEFAALEATIEESMKQLKAKAPANIMIHANAEADIKPDIVVKTEPEDTWL